MITKINLDKLRIYLFLYLFNFIRALFKLPSPYNVKVPLKKFSTSESGTDYCTLLLLARTAHYLCMYQFNLSQYIYIHTYIWQSQTLWATFRDYASQMQRNEVLIGPNR